MKQLFDRANKRVSFGGAATLLIAVALVGQLLETQMFGYETPDAFGEDQGRYLVTTSGSEVTAFEEFATKAGVPCAWLGVVGGTGLSIRGEQEFLVGEAPQNGIDKSPSWTIPLADLRAAHEGFFPALMGADAALA